MKAQTLLKHLEKRFDGIRAWVRDDSHLIVSAEDGTMIGNLPLADYYDFSFYDPKEINHEFGINRKLLNFLKKKGYGVDWENPGALYVYRDN